MCVCVCVCVCASAEDGTAFGKWRVSARTCQKGPQSSCSREATECASECVCVRACVLSIAGEQKMSTKRPHL